MSCYAQGRCRFCGQKHTLLVFGREETEHNLIQRTNLKLIVLNTVCSSCIAIVENQLKGANFRLPCKSDDVQGDEDCGCNRDVDEDRDNYYDNSNNRNDVPHADHIGHDEMIIMDKVTLSSIGKRCNETRAECSTARHLVEQQRVVTAVSRQTMRNVSKRHGKCRKRNCSTRTCEFCAKSFTHTGDLNKHRRKHTGERPYECSSCQQRFSHASNLIRHRRVHSGERPFSCQYCNRAFARSDKLTRHSQRQCCSTSTVTGRKRERGKGEEEAASATERKK